MKNKCPLRMATELIGTKIITLQGENIGVVQNMMIDTEESLIIYIVLCYANFIGKTNRYFAIPSRMMKLSPAEKPAFVLDISREKLMDASGRLQDEWLLPFWPLDDQRIHELYEDEKKSLRQSREKTKYQIP